MPQLTGVTELPGGRHLGRRLLAWSAVGLAAACVVGFVGQTIAARRDERRFPPPGRMVDVGGSRMHLDVRGDDRGAPTVVLEAGLGSFSPNWHWVQEALADSLRVVAYDRAGLGWSEPSPAPRDAETMAAELHAALHAADIDGPYVLAGHSFGGLVVRAFADAYRPETAGLVLVDASHPDQWARWPVPYADRIQLISMRVMAAAAWVGLPRIVDLFGAVSAGLPDRQVAELNAHFALPRTSITEAAQMRAWERFTRPRINRAAPLGDLPLAVIGVGVQPLGAETLTALQEELPGLSTNSARRVVPSATHESLIADRENATRVANAIRAVVDAVGDERVETTWAAREAHPDDR
jgi:pimeloyl-ACP methyl ester carboxylesterase